MELKNRGISAWPGRSCFHCSVHANKPQVLRVHQVRSPERLESVSLAFLNSFFDWLLGQRTGEDWRKRRTTKSSSLATYWKAYRLVYERATSGKVDANIAEAENAQGRPSTQPMIPSLETSHYS
jgi:hypothetical protein